MWDKQDIYAISLYVYDYCDNPCEPIVTLGYNTEDHFRSQIANAYGEQEAKWNYAYWFQNQEYVFGIEDTKPVILQWMEEKGFRYYTYEEMFNGEKSPDSRTYDGITEASLHELVLIVRKLHESGYIKKQFGKTIPVLIHGLEYHGKIARQNMDANPVNAVKEFVRFCCSC